MNIKVKALEWAEHPSGKPLWRAHAPSIGWYGASALISPASWRFDGLDETVTHDVADIDAAKAAAQADYERRILSAIEPSTDMSEAAKALTEDQIMEVIKEVAPWKHEPAFNDLLTYEKSPPLFPQATYDVPSYRAVNFVRAVERRLRSLTGAKP